MAESQKKEGRAKPWTDKLWVYDLRTNKHFTLKQSPIQRTDFDEFVDCYKPGKLQTRKPTWTESNPEGRWRCYDYEELLKRDKLSLDLFWIKDQSLTDTDNLPAPDILATEIADDLEAALEKGRSTTAEEWWHSTRHHEFGDRRGMNELDFLKVFYEKRRGRDSFVTDIDAVLSGSPRETKVTSIPFSTTLNPATDFPLVQSDKRKVKLLNRFEGLQHFELQFTYEDAKNKHSETGRFFVYEHPTYDNVFVAITIESSQFVNKGLLRFLRAQSATACRSTQS